MGWSKSDETAILWASENPKNGKVYIWNEYYHGQRLVKDHVLGFIQGCKDKKPEKIFYDSAARQEAEEMKAYFEDYEYFEKQLGLSNGTLEWMLDVEFIPAFKSVDVGIDAVDMGFRSGKLSIFKDACPNLEDELEVYQRDDDGKVIKGFDNSADSLRYLYATMYARSSDEVSYIEIVDGI